MKQLRIRRFPALDYACTEAMNTLCTNLSYCGTDIHTLLITSRYEQEGKSSVAMNVMRTLASYGKKVLLIDVDLRRSTLARRYGLMFEQDEAFGLAQYLAGMCLLEDVVYQTDIPGAYMIPVGRSVLNSVQLLASNRFGEMIDRMREEYDIILLDTPPAGVIVDAIEIAKHCDGATIVVGYNKGRNQDIGDIVTNINKTGCQVLGAVINGVNMKSFRNRRYYYRSEQYSTYYRRQEESTGSDTARHSAKGRQ